jgi:hypothetical protein
MEDSKTDKQAGGGRLEAGGTAAALTPLAALRVIAAVQADRSLSHAQARVIVQVILQADGRTGRSWVSQRQLRDRTGASYDVIASALRADGGAAIGRYLEAVCRGAHGAICYRVLAVSCAPASGAQDQPADDASAPASGAQDDVSAPATGAPQRSSHRSAEPPALHSDGSSAPATGTILAVHSGELPDCLDGPTDTPPPPTDPAGRQAVAAAPTEQQRPETQTEQAEALAAWRQTTGQPGATLPEAFAGGPAPLAAYIRAARARYDRAGEQYHRQRGEFFGIGWVLKQFEIGLPMTPSAVPAGELDPVDAACRQRMAEDAARRARQDQSDAAARQEAMRRLEAFHALPADRQEQCRKAVRARCGKRLPPPRLLEEMAAMEAQEVGA